MSTLFFLLISENKSEVSIPLRVILTGNWGLRSQANLKIISFPVPSP